MKSCQRQAAHKVTNFTVSCCCCVWLLLTEPMFSFGYTVNGCSWSTEEVLPILFKRTCCYHGNHRYCPSNQSWNIKGFVQFSLDKLEIRRNLRSHLILDLKKNVFKKSHLSHTQSHLLVCLFFSSCFAFLSSSCKSLVRVLLWQVKISRSHCHWQPCRIGGERWPRGQRQWSYSIPMQ